MDGLTLSPAAPASAVSQRRAAETLLFAFLATVVMLFAGFTSAALIRRAGSDWSPAALPPLAWANLLPLALGSVALELARRGRTAGWTRVALGSGVLFLIGQVLIWSAMAEAGALLTTSASGAFFCLLLGLHALHLLGGLGALTWVAVRSGVPRLAAVYWHFLGAMWLYVLLLLRVL